MSQANKFRMIMNHIELRMDIQRVDDWSNSLFATATHLGWSTAVGSVDTERWSLLTCNGTDA